MDRIIRHNAPELWIEQIFSAKAAAKGGLIRRNRHWLDTEVGREQFFAEVRARGFHLLETADQLIVVCHNGAVRMYF